MMKRFVSNDNFSSASRGQGGVNVSIEPRTHGVHIDADLSWEAVDHFNSLFVAFGKFQQVIQFKSAEQSDQEQRRAENDNVYEARKAENLSLGERYAEGVDDLCIQGYTRHDAISQIAKSYGRSISEITMLIKLHNKSEREERQDNVKNLVLAGKSAAQIGKELGVSKSQAHRIMQSVKGTGDV